MRKGPEAIRPSVYSPDVEGERFNAATGAAIAPFVHSRGKRAFDIVFAVTAIALALPLVVLIAVAITLTSPGPVFFRQRRLGVGGTPFTVLKFRTMHASADENIHRQFVRRMNTPGEQPQCAPQRYKLENDCRVTAIGRWLRRTSLDELPQFFNVVRGEMSLVGPRPPLEYEVDDYAEWQTERLTAKPGITGLWQVSGRNRLSYLEMCRIDIEYIRTWSFLRDLAIVIKTPWVMFSNSGQAA